MTIIARWLAFVVLLLPGMVWAQTPRQMPLSLGSALTAATPPVSEVALTVSADLVSLPKDGVLPTAPASVEDVAEAFGRITHRFGAVLAIAPPTMVVLNTHPTTPNIYDGMPTGDALKLLAATLTPAQWHVLTSDQGLGVSDLGSDDQRALFFATLGARTLRVRPKYQAGMPYDPNGEHDLTEQIPQVHLHLGQTTELELPTSSRSWRGISMPDALPITPRYELVQDYSKPNVYGVSVRAELPNETKPGGLDFRCAPLSVLVPLDKLKTVGELVTQIAALTHLELYADPHYAGQSLTIVGAPSASAGNLLQALALCVSGTFRPVGPAFVLTDDLMGVGTRRLILSLFEQSADQRRRKPLDAAGDLLSAAHSMTDLPSMGDPTFALSPQEVRLKAASLLSDYDQRGVYLHLPLSQLTPAQQKAAQAMAAQAATETFEPGDVAEHPPGLEGDLLLITQPHLELLVPMLDGPIEMRDYQLQDLFKPSDETLNKRREARIKTEQKQQSAAPAAAHPAPPVPTLAALFKTIPRRAVIAAPRTADEVDALIGSMRTLGLNQLWLDVFSGGVCHVPGSSLSASASGPAGANDILTEALARTKGTDIAVFPMLDLLTWGAGSAPEARDLSLLGETSEQVEARQQQMYRSDTDPLLPFSGRVSVCPFAPAVREPLVALVRLLASRPGIAGLVWRETAPAGYVGIDGEYRGDDALGYSESARLAFLRAAHTDPLDIASFGGKADTSLPNFDYATSGGDPATRWNQFRTEGDMTLLRALFAAAAHNPALPILVRQRGQSWNADWYGSWDRLQAPLPAYVPPWIAERSGGSVSEEASSQAALQSRITLRRLDSWAAINPEQLARALSEPRKGIPWGGFVLDFAPTNEYGSPSTKPGENPLARLAGGSVHTP